MRKFVAGVAVAFVMLAGGVTACGSSPPPPPVPASWAVSYMGTNYCPYQYTSFETQAYGFTGACTPIAYPSVSVMPIYGSLEWALTDYWTKYSRFYMSDYWFYHYYAPLGSQYHITLISYRSYMSNVTTFHTTYASQIKTNSAKATYVGKNGKTTGDYTFPTTNKADAQKIWSNNTSTSRTTSGSATTTGGGGAPAVKAPAVKAPVRAPTVGKGGRR